MTGLYVPALAALYLAMQLPALFWTTGAWPRFAHLPIWVFAASLIVLVAGQLLGSPLAPILLIVSLPLMVTYLAIVWAFRLVLTQRSARTV